MMKRIERKVNLNGTNTRDEGKKVYDRVMSKPPLGKRV